MVAETSPRAPTGLLAIAALGIPAAVAAVTLDWRLAIPVGLTVPLLAWVVLSDTSPGPDRALPASDRGIRLFESERFLAWTWAALVLTPGLRVISQDSSRYGGQAASGNLTVDNILMLLASTAALLAVGFALQRGWPARPTNLLRVYLVFSGLALLSMFWSRLPLYTFGRGVQYVALAAFTALTAGWCLVDRSLFPRLLDKLLRPYLGVVVALGIWGMATHGFADRFQWPGTHPNACASFMAIGVLLVLINPRRARVLAPVPWPVPIVLLLPLIYQTGARGYTMTMVGALAVAGAVLAMRDGRWFGLFAGVGLVSAAVAMTFFYEDIVGFLHRGQSTDEVLSLNGRVEAWQYALQHPPGNQVWGVGLGANQGTIDASWNPFNAHSAWIDLLQTLGVIGVSLMATVVLATVALSLVRRFAFGVAFGAFVLVASLTSTTIAVPDAMPAVLSLAIVGAVSAPHREPTARPVLGPLPPIADDTAPHASDRLVGTGR